MADIYGPILPLQLDPRNTPALVRDMQTKVFLESGGQLNDFSPASPLSALVEGQAYAQSELLYYLNALPEAYTLQWLRQLGIQRSVGAKAIAEVTFIKTSGFNRTVVIPAGVIVSTTNRLNFVLKEEVRIGDSITSAIGQVTAEKWGTEYNVSSGDIQKINVNILGLDGVTNETSAQGGKGLESIESMKTRAFSLLKRRGLITAEDYEQEIISLAPESVLIKVLTYEERFDISPDSPTGVVMVCVGGENGESLETITRQNLLKSLKKKIPLGNSVSLITPEITPVETTVVIQYDDEEYSGGIATYASQINQLILDLISPQEIGLGEQIDYQDIFNQVYNINIVDKIKSLSFDLLQVDMGNDVNVAICNAPFVSQEINGVCINTLETSINSVDNAFTNINPIRSFRAYKNVISFIASSTQAPLTYTFVNTDYDVYLRGA
jgi:hypothetical protein